MNNLPELSSNQFIWNGKIGYSGSLIKRTIPSTLNIYTHYGLIYGFDKNGILWIIENNQNGVECVTFKDFLAGNPNYAIEPLADASKSWSILLRVFERSSLKYDKRYNNCDHFVNYALYGVAKSIQTEITENIVNFTLTVAEISSRDPKHKKVLKMLNDLRKTLNLPKQSETKNKSKYSSKKLKGK